MLQQCLVNDIISEIGDEKKSRMELKRRGATTRVPPVVISGQRPRSGARLSHFPTCERSSREKAPEEKISRGFLHHGQLSYQARKLRTT